MSNFCEVPRWDFTGTQPTVPDCGHQTCADDAKRHETGYAEDSLWACPAGRYALAWLEAQCELDAGHTGDHDFGERSDPATWSDVDLGNGYPWPRAATAGAGAVGMGGG